MTPTTLSFRIALTIVLSGTMTACRDLEVLSPEPPSALLFTVAGNPVELRDMKGFPIDILANLPSIGEKEAKIMDERGLAFIAFKAPDSPRSNDVGYRHTLNAAGTRAGLRMVESLGVEILEYYPTAGSVLARRSLSTPMRR